MLIHGALIDQTLLRLVFQNQIEQFRRTERAALAGGLQEADWWMKNEFVC